MSARPGTVPQRVRLFRSAEDAERLVAGLLAAFCRSTPT